MPARFAQGSTPRPTQHFVTFDATHEGRRIGHYATRGKRVIPRDDALAGMRAFLTTGTPAPLQFSFAWQAEDRVLGLSLLR